MVRMENYYHLHDKVPELWREIDKCHLAYLEMEDSPEKLEQRNKLEDYIHKFLCITIHYQKFAFSETEEVLYKSARHKKDFSAYKAATGFNAIQLYAQNLLSQPWRKEYRQIRTYCGFYKHQIEANLVEAEIIFGALGYNYIGEGLMVLDGPICVDRVVTVSKDCLIAYVECQILKAIWEDISTVFKISWLEVLEYRKAHICGPEQAIKSINYKHHQREFQEHNRSFSQGSDPFIGTRCQAIPANMTVPNMSPVMPMNHSFPPLSSHHHIGLPTPPPEYLYSNGCCSNSYATFGPSYAYLPYGQPVIKPQFNSNGYYYNGCAPQVPPAYVVPTAKLIEVDSHNGQSYDVIEKVRPRNVESIHNDLYKTKNNNEVVGNLIDKESDKNESDFEDWDYVYRNLENQGYSKDLGERGDVLSPRQIKEVKRVKATNLDEALNNLTVNDKPLKVSEVLKKFEPQKKIIPVEVVRTEREPSPPSSYENLTTGDEIKKQVMKTLSTTTPQPSYAKTKTLSRDKNGLPDKPLQSKTLEIKKPKEDKPIKKDTTTSLTNLQLPLPSDKWQCKACTYLNDTGNDICDMCSKTRHAASDPPMEIGGAECAKCTLVNPKNFKVCQACGASLKDSPTYI